MGLIIYMCDMIFQNKLSKPILRAELLPIIIFIYLSSFLELSNGYSKLFNNQLNMLRGLNKLYYHPALFLAITLHNLPGYSC